MAQPGPGVGRFYSEAVDVVDQAVEALQPETALLTGTDMVGFGPALRRLGAGLARHPDSAARALRRFGFGLTSAVLATAQRATGGSVGPVVDTAPKDKRFADTAFTGNALFFGLQQAYLLFSRLMDDLTTAAELEGPEGQKAEFALRLLVDALAPTNTLVGNPAALRKAFDTGGLSVLRGVRNMLDDLTNNGGMPRQVDTSPFTVGTNMAVTPGSVVYRNDLIELIQYDAQTESVFQIPLVLSPPWINKYYIMDLAPGKSFVEWSVQHGHTTFAISYRNPDSSMRDVSFDDYLINSPLASLDVIAEITGQPKVNIVGLCLGGTLTTILLAYLAHRGDDRIGCATLLNTLVDFEEPGALGVFTDEVTIGRLEASMAEKGYLEASKMAGTFDLLRANDLIFNYVGTNWLMGGSPPAFDLLAWNADSTRMPAAMHSFYLRNCYLENRLARGDMEVADTPLRLEDITEETYILGARDDHIAPWRSQYRTSQLLKSPRFVLSTSGHIAGIVNPPSPKAAHWTNEALPPDPDVWLAGATQHAESWWEDWSRWIGDRAGRRRRLRVVGSKGHPPLSPAPGTYVRGT